MVSVVFWLAILALLLIVANYSSGRIMLSPQFGFIACFIPQAIYALFYVSKWDLDLSFNTMVVLIGGCSCFLLVSMLISKLPKVSWHISAIGKNKAEQNSYAEIHVEKWKFIALLLFQSLVLVLLFRYLLKLPGGSFAEKMFFRDYTSKRVEGGLAGAGYDLPSYLSISRAFSYYSGFITSYLMLHGMIYHYKSNRFIMIFSYFFSVLSSLLLGQRFGAYSLIVATFVQWYFIRGKRTGWKRVISAKILGRAIIILFLFMLVFVQLGSFIGKGTKTTGSDYIAVYLAAQLKNLDIYVRKGEFGCGVENWQTLYGWVNFFADSFGISAWKHFYDQPFYYYNGYSLGNVSTVFYWFLHDGGYAGLFIFTSLMAIISQSVYSRAAKDRRKNTIDMSVVIYSYLFYGIVFSFYSNRFYSAINPDFIKLLLSLYVLKWYFLEFRVSLGRHKQLSTGGISNV